jgi:hypothetical protein
MTRQYDRTPIAPCQPDQKNVEQHQKEVVSLLYRHYFEGGGALRLLTED